MSLYDWAYRRTHTITHPTGNISNYQTKIIVYRDGGSTVNGSTVHLEASKVKPDFGDIRFTDISGTELDYWIESVDGTTSAVFWVELDYVYTSTTIYIYYGNPSATTTSNGSNTFLFFDDFSGDLSKWNTYSTPTVSGGICTINAASEAIVSKTTYGTGTAIRAKCSCTNVNYGNLAYCASYSTFTSNSVWVRFTSSTTYAYSYLSSGGNTSLGSLGGGVTRTWDLIRTGTANIFYVDNTLAASHTSNVTTNSLPVVFSDVTGAPTLAIDWIFVRTYITTDITQTEWGSEELYGGVSSFTIRITPTSGTDPLSVTYNCIIPEGTLTNFVLNYGDGNEYRPVIHDSIWDAYPTTGYFGPIESPITYRSVIPAGSIASSTTTIQVTIHGSDNELGDTYISHVSIVERDGTTANGVTIPTEITFRNGQSGAIIQSVDRYVYSDPVPFTLDNTKDYLLIVDYTSFGATDKYTFDGTSYVTSGTSWDSQTLSGDVTTLSYIVGFDELYSVESYPVSSFTSSNTYSEPGTYTVWGEGYTEFATHVYYEIPYGVNVSAPAVVASFTTSQSYNTVIFTNTSTGNINECYWTFGDGYVSYETNPVHTYYSPATYNVTLYTSNQYQYDEYISPITISQVVTPPSAYFIPAKLDVVSPTLPYSVTFTNLSTPSFGCTYNWTVDGGTVSTSENPTVSFTDYGLYDVGLIVTNTLGSSSRVYNNAIRLTRKSRTMNEVVGGSDSFATFGCHIFVEYPSGSDLPLVYATILPEGVYFIQREIPDVPGIDEWGVRHLYSTINEWGIKIFNTINSWGHKILHNSSSVDRTPLKCIDVEIFEETVTIADDHQFDEDPS